MYHLPLARLGCALLFLMFAPTTVMAQPDTGAQPLAVVIDTDMAPDDWMAILYLLQRPDAVVKAISITGTGETHCSPGIRNALGLLALADHPAVPVACGREKPLKGEHAFPNAWREGADGVMGLTLPQSVAKPVEQTAVELLATTIQSSAQKITLLTLGPLTNVAELLQANPDIIRNLAMIYVMGGAVDVPGNIAVSGVEIKNEVAEWNIYVDPYAADIVFKSGAPITLVPLDATNKVPISTAFYRKIERAHDTPEATFVFGLLTKFNEFGFIQSGNYFFWDPLAAAILSDESLASIQARKLSVVHSEGPESGRTKADENGAKVCVVVSADGARFEEVFLNTLNGLPTSAATTPATRSNPCAVADS